MSETGYELELARRAIDVTRSIASEAEVLASVQGGRSAYTRFARNEIIAGADSTDTSVWLNVAIGRRQASARSNQTDDASLRALAERALTFAKLSP